MVLRFSLFERVKSTLFGNSFVAEVYSGESEDGDDDGELMSVVLIDTSTDDDINVNEVRPLGL